MLGKKTEMELRQYTEVSDGMGGVITSYAGLRKITGVLSTITGTEMLSENKLTVIADFYWYIDYPVGVEIQEKDIFVKDTTTYKIIYIQNIGHNQNNKLRIVLKEED